jgi:hypothetical protein
MTDIDFHAAAWITTFAIVTFVAGLIVFVR